jgi:hypothetical protein
VPEFAAYLTARLRDGERITRTLRRALTRRARAAAGTMADRVMSRLALTYGDLANRREQRRHR